MSNSSNVISVDAVNTAGLGNQKLESRVGEQGLARLDLKIYYFTCCRPPLSHRSQTLQQDTNHPPMLWRETVRRTTSARMSHEARPKKELATEARALQRQSASAGI